MPSFRVYPSTTLPYEQNAVELKLHELSEKIYYRFGARFTPSNISVIADARNEVSAHRIFREFADAQDVFITSSDVYYLIDLMVSAYNEYSTLVEFGNSVADSVVEYSIIYNRSVNELWPKDKIGNPQNSIAIYTMAQNDFRQTVRDFAHYRLNHKTNIGAFVTLIGDDYEYMTSNVSVTPVEELCSWIDMTSNGIPGTVPVGPENARSL